MATTTKSTKAKTKTTKSAVKRSAAKTRVSAAKTVKASKSAKITKPVQSKTKANVISTDSLRKLHLFKAFVTAALAVAAGFLMSNTTYAISIGYQAKDELVSLTAGKTAFVHASQSILDIQVRWLVITVLVISAIFSLLIATRWRKKYEAALIDKVSPVRWIGMGITSALIVEVVALLSGVSDIRFLKLLAGLIVATCALGWVAEKRNKQAGRPVWSEFVVSLFTGLLPWLLILSYAVSTWVYGLIRYPWFVYAVMASTLAGFILLAVNQYKHISGWKNYLIIERNYVTIATLTHAAFAVILILGFQK